MMFLKRFIKTALLLIGDSILVWLSYFFALLFRLGIFPGDKSEYIVRFLKISPVLVLPFLIVMWLIGNYRSFLQFTGLGEIIKTILASFTSALLAFLSYSFVVLYLPNESLQIIGARSYLPRAVFFIAPFVVSILVCFSRILVKYTYLHYKKTKRASKMHGNALIIGAGDAGALLVDNIRINNYLKDLHVVGIIDDDPLKLGREIHGIRVLGNRRDIINIAKKKNVDIIIFAIPSCDNEQKREILNICQKTGCSLKTLPPIYQLTSGDQISERTIRDVDINDLLGREAIKIDLEQVKEYVGGKVVMVTGGGGSIGSELCRQIAVRKPKQLIIFDIYENNAYEIQNELKRNYPDLDLVVLIGSVRDSKRLEQVFSKYKPQVVYHAAAHKHVPLMEDSPNEAIKNNVMGTYKTARAADKHGTQRFVLISTDKAVNPTNIMGASKRICEMIVQSFNARSKTEFVAVRFGNVLGSNGSVIPLFKKQIEAGGPITVTDPDIIRYFMTIPEAVSLVLQAGASAKGGEIFVLDMGKPVRILDMAENMIRLSGLTPYVDIDIRFIGLRPGEKKYEELLMDEEGLEKTDNNLIYIGRPIEFNEDDLWEKIGELEKVMYDDSVDLRSMVKELVPTYRIPKSE